MASYDSVWTFEENVFYINIQGWSEPNITQLVNVTTAHIYGKGIQKDYICWSQTTSLNIWFCTITLFVGISESARLERRRCIEFWTVGDRLFPGTNMTGPAQAHMLKVAQCTRSTGYHTKFWSWKPVGLEWDSAFPICKGICCENSVHPDS